jgi:hypothetical protein
MYIIEVVLEFYIYINIKVFRLLDVDVYNC